MRTSDFFLAIARDQFNRLKACAGPLVLGNSECSEHFHHAVICSVFSAFAVEHALTEFIWVRCFYQTPQPYRRIALQHALGLRTVPAKLDFVQATTTIPIDVVDDMKKLFEYRNRVAHCYVVPFEGRVLDVEGVQALNESGRGLELDKAIDLALRGKPGGLDALANEWGRKASYLQLPGLGTPDIEAAVENLRIAERAVEAIRRELDSPEWPAVALDEGP